MIAAFTRPVTMRRHVLFVLLLAAGCDGSPLEQSCAGRAVGLCAPYEYAAVTSASMEPAELPVADFALTARIRVVLARCAAAPAPHAVHLDAIVPDEDPADGGTGEPVSVLSLIELRDGADADPVEGDGVIDVEVVNPLLTTVPAETDIILRFRPRSTAPLGCTGASFELPYRTGPRRE